MVNFRGTMVSKDNKALAFDGEKIDFLQDKDETTSNVFWCWSMVFSGRRL